MDSADDAPPGQLLSTRVAVLSIACFWLFYFAIVTLRSAALGFDDQLDLLGRRAVVTAASMALTLLFYFVLRRFDAKALRTGILVAGLLAIPAATAYATINYLAFKSYDEAKMAAEAKKGVIVTRNHRQVDARPADEPRPPAPPTPPRGVLPPLPAPPLLPGEESAAVQVGGAPQDHEEKTPLMAIADQAANGYFFFAAWAALYLALSYAAAVRAAERRMAAFRAAAQSAELRALRYQVNPHFLFNTLNSLSSLVLGDKREEAERMIMNLATFFRTSLTGDPTEDVPLFEEIRLQRLYLDIEAVRFPERLVVDIDVPDALRTTCVPGLILQPLVENAVKYGVSRSRRPVTIRIRAREDSDGLVLMIEDDGDSVSEEERETSTGLGLRNVCERLAARFGEKGRCRWGPLPGGGFAVMLFMPLIRHVC